MSEIHARWVISPFIMNLQLLRCNGAPTRSVVRRTRIHYSPKWRAGALADDERIVDASGQEPV
jgi:hypothetical protein